MDAVTTPCDREVVSLGARRRRYLVPVGAFLLVASIYVISGPGRVDVIDGQYRFEVAHNLVHYQGAFMRDPALPRQLVGRDGKRYAFYGPGGSVAALPLVATAAAIDPANRPLSHFMFSFTSALYGAGAAIILFLLYELLGISRRRALAWSAVMAFATLVWPMSTSTFDQAQHAFFAIASIYTGFVAARNDRTGFAFLSGFSAAFLVLFQEIYIVLLPAFALVLLRRDESLGQLVRSRRFRAFVAAALLAVAGLLLYNVVRLGTLLAYGQGIQDVKVFGNPFVGALGLLASPAKSVFLYSPPLLLALLGWRRFHREHRNLARAAAAVVLLQFAIIASLTFFGGDWTWGPRYSVVTLPLVCIALPFIEVRRATVVLVFTVGVIVQLLGVAVDHQRFFFERAKRDFFWMDPWVNFQESALFARPHEAMNLLYLDDVPASRYAPNPYMLPTYTTFGNRLDRREEAPEWMQNFALFYMPRPWPLWMPQLREYPPTVPWRSALAITLSTMLLGVALLIAGLRERPTSSAADAKGV